MTSSVSKCFIETQGLRKSKNRSEKGQEKKQIKVQNGTTIYIFPDFEVQILIRHFLG